MLRETGYAAGSDGGANSVRLRPTLQTDLDFVLRLEADPDTAPLIHAWPIEEHRAAMSDPGVAHWIVEDAEQRAPVGFVILRGLDTEVIELRRIAISEKGRGYGTSAMRLVKEVVFGEMGARRIWLDVYDFNDRARSIYEAEGFSVESERPAAEACGGCVEGTAILMSIETQSQDT